MQCSWPPCYGHKVHHSPYMLVFIFLKEIECTWSQAVLFNVQKVYGVFFFKSSEEKYSLFILLQHLRVAYLFLSFYLCCFALFWFCQKNNKMALVILV